MPTRIPTHRPRHAAAVAASTRKAYDSADSRKADKAFYQTPRWRALRALKLRLNPLCESCKALGILTEATEVHHTVERKLDPSKAFDLDYLKADCKACHNAERRRRVPDRGGGGGCLLQAERSETGV